MQLQIEKAIEQYNSTHGKKLTKTELAKAIWGDNPKASDYMSLLIHGKKKFVKLDWIATICEVCGVDANFLIEN